MAKLKYANCLVQKPGPFPLELQRKGKNAGKDLIPGVKATHLMTADESVQEGFFTVDCTWLWSGAAKEPVGEAHTHDFSHVLGFIGGSQADPHDLGGEITVWLDGHKEVLNRSCLVFVPAGVVHGPILFNEIGRRVFFITIAMTGKYARTPAPVTKPSKVKRYSIVDRTKERFTVAAGGKAMPPPPPPPKHSTVKSNRILHIEDDIVKGSFYVDFVWIWSGTGGAPAPEHTHDWPELIAMAGADPAHPRDLGGEMSIVLGDEYHATTKSTLVCIPKYLKHCPWEFHDIRRPTLVFSAGPRGMYTGSHKKE